MNFFNGLSQEASALLAAFMAPQPTKRTCSFRLEIKNQHYTGTELTEVELPYQYTSEHNAQLMYDELNALSHDDIRFIAAGVRKRDDLGPILSVFVRRIYG